MKQISQAQDSSKRDSKKELTIVMNKKFSLVNFKNLAILPSKHP